jgi:secreted Zn-dependent insulinase-like peptidase
VRLANLAQYYIAPRMTLVLVAAEPLDQMQRWADSLFAKVGGTPA